MIIIPSNVGTRTSRAVTWISAAIALSSSVTIPAHQTGDIILLTAFNRTVNPAQVFAPTSGGTVPAWNYLGGLYGFIDGSGNNISFSSNYFKATSSTTTSGTWINANLTMVAVLRPAGATVEINKSQFYDYGQSTSGGTTQVRPSADTYGTGNGKSVYMFATFANVTIGAMSGWTTGLTHTYSTIEYLSSSPTGNSYTTKTLSPTSNYAGVPVEVVSFD